MAVFYQLELPSRAPDRRMLVTGVRSDTAAGGYLDHRAPHCYKHLRGVISLYQLSVHAFKSLAGSVARLKTVFDQSLGDHHKERCGDTLARYVRHHHSEVVVIHQEKIVKVAADLLCGVHGRVDVKLIAFGKRGENTRQHVFLNSGSHSQIAVSHCLLTSLRDVKQTVHEQHDEHDHTVAERKPVGEQRHHSGRDRCQHVHEQRYDLVCLQLLSPYHYHAERTQHGNEGIHQRERIESTALIETGSVHGKVKPGKNICYTHQYRCEHAYLDDLAEHRRRPARELQISRHVMPEEAGSYRRARVIEKVVDYIKDAQIRHSVKDPRARIREQTENSRIDQEKEISVVGSRLLHVDKAADKQQEPQHHAEKVNADVHYIDRKQVLQSSQIQKDHHCRYGQQIDHAGKGNLSFFFWSDKFHLITTPLLFP